MGALRVDTKPAENLFDELSALGDDLFRPTVPMASDRLQLRSMLPTNNGGEQTVGPERRERVSHQTWCGEG